MLRFDKDIHEPRSLIKESTMADLKLTDVEGIGPKTAEGLATLGIDSIKALAAAPVEIIATLPGFFASRAEAVKTAAGELIGKAPRGAGAARSSRKTSTPKRPHAATAKKTAKEPADKPPKKKKKKKKIKAKEAAAKKKANPKKAAKKAKAAEKPKKPGKKKDKKSGKKKTGKAKKKAQ